jgi:hypothetical protein
MAHIENYFENGKEMDALIIHGTTEIPLLIIYIKK